MAGLRGDVRDSDVGFFDASGIRTGAGWREALAGALRSCRVMVCLYSRGYFNSEYCGKELSIFRSRIDGYLRAAPDGPPPPPLIIPVLWDRPDRLPKPLPAAVTGIQHSDAELGKTYAVEGLYFLMKVSKFRGEYEEFLLRFAEKVFRAGEPDLLPPLTTLPDLDAVRNAFSEKAPSPPGPDAPEKSAYPRVAQFVYVAGGRSEVKAVRENVNGYGEQGGREWQPYYPEVPKSIGVLSQGIATMEDLQYETCQVGEGLIERIRKAEEANSIVVIVVDPWSVRVKSYRGYMLDFDKTDFLNCGVLVPWNDKDDETSKSLRSLRVEVRGTFARKFILNTYIKDSIHSMEELGREISASINEVRRRLLLKAEVQRPVDSAAKAMPSLSGPDGTST